MAGGTFDSDLDALLKGTVPPVPGTPPSSDPLADLLAGSGSAPGNPAGPAAGGAVDISVLVGLTPSSAPASPLDVLLAGPAEPQGPPSVPTTPVPVPLPTGPITDPLQMLLQPDAVDPFVPAEPPVPPVAPTLPPAVPAVPVEDQVAVAFAPLAAPQLDREVARRIPSEARRRLPHARCPHCGKPGIPPVSAATAADQAAVIAGLAWAGPEGDGWRCLGCGEGFLSRESSQVLNNDAEGFARLRQASERLAGSLGLTP